MAGSIDLLGGGGSLDTPSLGDSIGGSSNKGLMADARMALSGNWGMAILGFVLYYILIMTIGFFTGAATFFIVMMGAAAGMDATVAVNTVSWVAQVFQMVLAGAFLVGFYRFFLVIAQDGEARLEGLFLGFKRFGTAFGVYFLTTLFTFLWMLLFIVPGIIAVYRYSMAFFIVADDEDVGPFEAIQQSKEMMKGNKWKLFCLQFRFFGWALLAGLFTFGIGFLWVVPYMQTSFAKFYEDVK